MTDRKNDGPDRRALLVGAAIAGTAASMAAASAADGAPAMAQEKGGTHIVVDLGGVKLPEEVARVLGDNVRKVVLETLATVDMRQSMVVLPHVRIPPDWNGIWIRWSDQFPSPIDFQQ